MNGTNNNSLNNQLQDASASLDAFARGPAQDAADLIGDAFAKAGKRVSSALGEAARSGELSVRGLAASIVRDLSQIAIDRFVTAPINNALVSVFRALPNFGARANGGPVASGGAYLVGERGPELFVPNAVGQIQTAGFPSPVSIVINMAPGSSLGEVKRSSNQISAALARAVQRGSLLV
ncbi:phage tail tape measure C-terminal domain-containing protein [Candidatus Phycosocius spiralis]|uniref:Bacteriophage tail tape measure C-terminal domain-containing protein n=1 Tax=Candidatus Phycosocius spiralis TaxID=2815099 RepID=A0ABQ4PX78_9PROT|nr:phage tail tape measure C-terminal domain-containing protein [Candidatus Phycosocius spiralis]GIU67613.1 hypothetical protein PsB1_1767 [Candidatus Phycosocius spiralis]